MNSEASAGPSAAPARREAGRRRVAGVRRTWVRGLVAAGVLAAATGGCRQRDPVSEQDSTPSGRIHVLRPPPDSLVHGEVLEIVCQGAGLARSGCVAAVDGGPVRLMGFEPHFAVGTVRLGPGTHLVRVGQETRQVTVAAGAEGRWYRQHPPPAGDGLTCGSCHRPGEDLVAARDKGRCFTCHAESSFVAIHRHTAETLGQCSDCHFPHGGTAPALLKDDPASLCQECHKE
jgi:predicted CXXCH cytochrome family protein